LELRVSSGSFVLEILFGCGEFPEMDLVDEVELEFFPCAKAIEVGEGVDDCVSVASGN
jgi:methyl coenzyme M reductase subunit D